MIHQSKEMIEIQFGLWNVGRCLDVPMRDLSDGTFEKAIANLNELWQRFMIETEKQTEVPAHDTRSL